VPGAPRCHVRQVFVGKSALFNIAQRAREWLSDDREGAQSLPDIPSNAVSFSFDGLASKDQSCTTPFDMTGDRGNYLKRQLRDKLIEHKQYIDRYGEDLPEVRNWKWSRGGEQ
jgi:hypothetical protein